jgi:hypothetical protein
MLNKLLDTISIPFFFKLLITAIIKTAMKKILNFQKKDFNGE